MSLLGVESLVYGVDDVDRCSRFYDDFGLVLDERTPDHARFRLPEGSSVSLNRKDDPLLPPPIFDGPGPREVIWGVDSRRALDALADDLSHDRSVVSGADGTARCHDDSGLPIGFRVFERRQLPDAAIPGENSLSRVARWNRHRAWYERARPKQINHVVFGVPDVDQAVEFYTRRLGFRVTDIMRGFGMFMRCDGRHDHHNLFLMQLPRLVFSHVSFGVETIDELMVGANDMQRKGWTSEVGLGRHRISSLIFYYLNSPCGGQVEYSADSDYLNDDWTPRLWNMEFGHYHWLAVIPPNAHIARHGIAEKLSGPVPKLAETARATEAATPVGCGARS
jgi:catechol 2,3-dioxygenase-like lactoylglutathione lyase family enzyme